MNIALIPYKKSLQVRIHKNYTVWMRREYWRRIKIIQYIQYKNYCNRITYSTCTLFNETNPRLYDFDLLNILNDGEWGNQYSRGMEIKLFMKQINLKIETL